MACGGIYRACRACGMRFGWLSWCQNTRFSTEAVVSDNNLGAVFYDIDISALHGLFGSTENVGRACGKRNAQQDDRGHFNVSCLFAEYRCGVGNSSVRVVRDLFSGVNVIYVNITEETKMKKITQVEAKRIMDGGSDIYILDVREPDELYEGYIDESILIPLDDLNEKTAAEKLPDKNKAVLVYCRSGKRSMDAAERLDKCL